MKNKDTRNIFDYLAYNYDTGRLYWREKPSRGIKKGIDAGCESKHGITIRFEKLDYKASRLVWELFTGKKPERDVSFVDNNNLNTRFENLQYVKKIYRRN